jgi:hypothetical protein
MAPNEKELDGLLNTSTHFMLPNLLPISAAQKYTLV